MGRHILSDAGQYANIIPEPVIIGKKKKEYWLRNESM